MSNSNELTRWEKIVGLVFAGIIMAVLITFIFSPPQEVNNLTAVIISFFIAAAAGYSGYLFSGKIEGVLPFSKAVIKASGASATFLIVFILTLNFLQDYKQPTDFDRDDVEPLSPTPEVSLSFGDSYFLKAGGSAQALELKESAVENFSRYLAGKGDNFDGLYLAQEEFERYLGDYRSASADSEISGEQITPNPNDPEARIYLNNVLTEIKAQNAERQVLKLVVAVPIAVDPDFSAEVLRGIAQAQYELLQSPEILKGALLEVGIADDKDDAEVAKELARKVANPESSIIATVGHYSTNLTKEVLDIYNTNKKILISPTATGIELSRDDISYFFRTATSDAVAAKQLAEHIQTYGIDIGNISVAYVYGDSYGESLSKSFFGNKRPASQCDLGKRGYNAQNDCVDPAVQNDANAFLLIPSSNDIVDEAIDIITAIGEEIKLLGGDSLYQPEIGQTAIIAEQASASRLTIAIPWHRKGCNSLNDNDNFEQLACDLWAGNNISWRSATAYDAVQVVTKAISDEYDESELESITPDASKLADRMRDPEFNAVGATGTISFLGTGDRKDTEEIGVLVQFKVVEESGEESRVSSPETVEKYDFVQI
ncbi:ABC transporter substrate-binding protein [Leptolyngbya iicbica]|uniref:Receptor ligand binding region domain-containing protein n=2 Tax=Cyanophyceae TaxID=3028117 RepID=A0A4Q7EG03_9CYAN|nr:ABC transporter substrate-binding protein [Leptolyngbya sp. LK]RZM82182.1 hypothetical protein DYY88_02695 [Leptolyngbya sp. LK]